MDTHNLKKRRAYSHEESPAEQVLHENSFQTQPLQPRQQYIYNTTLAADQPVTITLPLFRLLELEAQHNQEFILHEAAAYLNVPYPILVSQKQHFHQRKRPRLNPDIPMPSPYPSGSAQQDQEKQSIPTHAPHDDNRRFSQLDDDLPGWSSSRIAECFASFAMCAPCTTFDSPSGYQSLPAATSFDDFSSARPSLLIDTAVHPHAPASCNNTPETNHQAFFGSDNATVVQYMASYPALQPTRVGMQPATSREEMVYPVTTTSSMNMALSVQGPPAQLLAHERTDSLQDPFVDPGFVGSRFAGFPGYSSPNGQELGRPDADFGGYQQNEKTLSQPRLPTARRKPFRDQDQREKTARTRKIGSCIRCRIQRIRCNEDEEEGENAPCMSCKKISTQKVFRMGCLRWKIMDVKLFKPGQVKGHEWTNRWRDSVVDDIGNWESTELRTIHVTEGYTGKSVQLIVRRFVPQDGDKVNRSWVSKDGSTKSISIPPYAIVNLDDAKNAFAEYIKLSLVECCKKLLGAKENLLWQTYILAIKTSRDPQTPLLEQRLLQSTLDLWMSVRLTTKSFEIVGNDTLGMARTLINDNSNPLYGKIPLPPVMGAQIDSVLIHQVQTQLRRKTLEELQKMICERKTKTWLTQYLVIFILLHNIALITRHDADYARKHGMKRRFAREDKVREYDHGANTLLAYFHHCNKNIYPFSAQCRDEELRTLAQLDNHGVQIIKYTRQFAANRKSEWAALREAKKYEDEYYYASQLFDEEWAPKLMASEVEI
ncbi:hypothetical protein GQ53DRAFT_747031 [Thozetella sp. PMI_491]|nr:hypothetical protein GQ53DRAFT_747031 [Thozetella sp. PMI_491]